MSESPQELLTCHFFCEKECELYQKDSFIQTIQRNHGLLEGVARSSQNSTAVIKNCAPISSSFFSKTYTLFSLVIISPLFNCLLKILCRVIHILLSTLPSAPVFLVLIQQYLLPVFLGIIFWLTHVDRKVSTEIVFVFSAQKVRRGFLCMIYIVM